MLLARRTPVLLTVVRLHRYLRTGVPLASKEHVIGHTGKPDEAIQDDGVVHLVGFSS